MNNFEDFAMELRKVYAKSEDCYIRKYSGSIANKITSELSEGYGKITESIKEVCNLYGLAHDIPSIREHLLS